MFIIRLRSLHERERGIYEYEREVTRYKQHGNQGTEYWTKEGNHHMTPAIIIESSVCLNEEEIKL